MLEFSKEVNGDLYNPEKNPVIMRELTFCDQTKSYILGEWRKNDANQWVTCGRCIQFYINIETMYVGFLNDGTRQGAGLDISNDSEQVWRNNQLSALFLSSDHILLDSRPEKYEIDLKTWRDKYDIKMQCYRLNKHLLDAITEYLLKEGSSSVSHFVKSRYYLE